VGGRQDQRLFLGQAHDADVEKASDHGAENKYHNRGKCRLGEQVDHWASPPWSSYH